jgi:hypothetical protein
MFMDSCHHDQPFVGMEGPITHLYPILLADHQTLILPNEWLLINI